MEPKYYILTLKQEGNFSTYTTFYCGSLIDFLINEDKLSKKTSIIWSEEISQWGYQYAKEKLKFL